MSPVPTSAEIPTISPSRLAELCCSDDVTIIDVRTPAEYREIHAAGARNVPLDALNPAALPDELGRPSDASVYVICKSGSRAEKACQKLIDAGFTSVINVEGGTDAWAAAGLPVVRGKKTISLERQVRIAAGFLVLAGALAGLFVHPYFTWLSAGVGAGLMFAGITDTCPMAMTIARMPWNQTGESSCCRTH